MPAPWEGMNFDSYFLSFARLARRSVLFWGHAVTSGVGAFDALRLRNGGGGGPGDDLGSRTGEGEDGGLSGSREPGDCLGNAAAGPGVWGHGATCPREIGGVDYFVSSWLFEDKSLGRRAQRKYSERWVGQVRREVGQVQREVGQVQREAGGSSTARGGWVNRCRRVPRPS